MNRKRKFKSCLITGITGSGGSYLAEYIRKIDKNIKIYGTYRSTGYKKLFDNKKNIKLFKCDLQKYNKLEQVLKNCKPQLIFHLASNADVQYSFKNQLAFTTNNNLITANLFQAVKKINFKTLIVLSSTSEVYGNVPKQKQPIDEKTAINPVNPYAVTKVFQDFLAQVYSKYLNLDIIILRMFTYSNPRRENLFQTAFAKQIVLVEKKIQKYVNHGNLNSVRTFMSTEDTMQAYWLAATKGKIGEIYNVGGKIKISIKDFLNKMISKSNTKIKTKEKKSLLRPVDIDVQVAKSDKFIRKTGWKENKNIDYSIQDLLNKMREKY